MAIFLFCAILCLSFFSLASDELYLNLDGFIHESEIKKTPEGRDVAEAMRNEFPNWGHGHIYYKIKSNNQSDGKPTKVMAVHAIKSNSQPKYLEVLSYCSLIKESDGSVRSSGISRYETPTFAPIPSP